MERGEAKAELPSVYTSNTFFWKKLEKGGGHGAVKSWTKSVSVDKHY